MKIVLCQIGNNRFWTQFIPDSAGVWYVDFDGVYTGIDSTLAAEIPTESVPNIVALYYDENELSVITSYTNTIDGRATALASNPGYIWDLENKRLYIRLPDFNPPFYYIITIGVQISLSNVSYDDTENNILYRPDLIGVPELSESKDPLFFEKLSFDEFTQQINNADRRYDGILNYKIFGQKVKYFIGNPGDVFSDFIQIKAGTVKTYQYDDLITSLKIIDDRAALSRKIPENTLSQNDYPNLKDEYIGTPKPLIYGYVIGHKCIPLDDDTTQTNYTFMIADTTLYDIKSSGYTIKMDGIDKTAQVLNFSATAGTFQLPAAHYTVGKDVTFTGYGYMDGGSELQLTTDIVKSLLVDYLDIAYTDDNFNTTEWDEEAAIAKNIGVSISDKMEVIKVIEEIAAGTGSGFILERDGRYTWRSYSSTALPVLNIYQHQWKYTPQIVGKSEEVLTSATAKYNQALDSKRWSRVTDDSKEREIFGNFRVYREKEFDTFFTSAADALTFAQGIMDRSDEIGLTISGVVDCKFFDFEEVKIGKLAQIEVNRQVSFDTYTEWLGKLKCEIIGVYPNIDFEEVEIVLRKVESIDEFEYIYDYDFSGDTTTDIYDFSGDTNSDILDFSRSN